MPLPRRAELSADFRVSLAPCAVPPRRSPTRALRQERKLSTPWNVCLQLAVASVSRFYQFCHCNYLRQCAILPANMASPSPIENAQRLTGVQWLICAIASLGFAFDTYELLVLPLIVRPALMEMAKIKPGSAEFNLWVGLLFYIPAVAGGIFGLLGGYLTDRLGRRRVLMWSILIYGFSAMGAGYATS